jgi:chorismate-pyruvate lyase
VTASDLPSDYHTLLANDKHMTVMLENFYGGPVQVRVLDSATTEKHYQRKVLVIRESDGLPVLFALVRVTRSLMDPSVREAIEGEQTPLGRILINQNVMRNVRPLSLWEIDAGQEIRELFQMGNDGLCYGRTALIYCDRVPAIELLEVVYVA